MSLDQNTVIIGLTGPLGSGSSFYAGHIEQLYGFPVFPLSKYVKEESTGQNVEKLQDIGNALRAKHGNDYLVKKALEEIEQEKIKTPIVIDSIRNIGEVQFLRRYRNFYLIATDATKSVRKERKGNEPGFEEYDKRDKEEEKSYGQQVTQCVYQSDIVINNGKNLRDGSIHETDFINRWVKYYIDLILNPGSTWLPTPDEAIMTLAYAQSLLSRCLKRRVGAVITTEDGDIISSGHNDVPKGLLSCKDEYGQCYKDENRIDFIKRIKKCPDCGGNITKQISCPKCDEKHDDYQILCSKKDCLTELLSTIQCENCGINIIKKFDPKDMSICRSLHAEESSIIKLARLGGGVSLKNAHIYITTYPCKLCANKIIEVGINNVNYVEPYREEETNDILRQMVKIKPFYGVKSSAYFKLYGGF